MAASITTWIPSKEDIRRLMKLVKVEYTLQVLLQKQESITGKTFMEDGLYLVLLAACQVGALGIIKYFLQNHSTSIFDIDYQFQYGYTQVWSRPVNYVTLIEDRIGFINDEKETRTDTLVSFTQKYNNDNKNEVIEMLQSYGAKVL